MIRRLDEENLTYAFPEVAFDEGYLIATYQAKVQTKTIEKLAMAIADEQTTGTWIKVGADSMEKTRRFGSKLVALYEVPDAGCDYQSDEPPLYIIQVAYPMENFSTSMSALLTILFGNISASGMIRLIDVAFPKKFIAQFQGPKFGVEGLRKVLGVPDRPLLNAMIKPNIGWTPDEGAELFYRACKGGVDIKKIEGQLVKLTGSPSSWRRRSRSSPRPANAASMPSTSPTAPGRSGTTPTAPWSTAPTA